MSEAQSRAGFVATRQHQELFDRTDRSCIGQDPELFFATDEAIVDEAKAFCARCPVRVQCLQYALDTGSQGIWGGMTDKERRRWRQMMERRYGRR